MEAKMVENGKKSWSETLNAVVTEYFNKNLPLFNLTTETSHSPFWGVTFSKDDLEIFVGGDIGFHISITIAGKEYALWQYDRSVNNAMETTEANILLQLNVLNKFVSEINMK